MDKLIVPERIFSTDEIKRLSPRERDAYIQTIILEILKLNKYVTVSQIDEQLHFSRPTIAKHLEILTAIGEAYRIQMGNLSVYSQNGKVVHEADLESIAVSGKIYTFYKLKNQEGDFLYMQERFLDDVRSSRVKGGIMINARDLPTFLEKLKDFDEKGEAKWLQM